MDTRAQTSDEPDWLPPSDQTFSARCQVSVSVLDSSKGSTHPPRIHTDTISGQVHEVKHSESARYFEVRLDERFIIPVEKVYVPVDAGRTGRDVAWRRSVPAQYELMVEIKCQDLEDSASFLALVEDKLPSDYHDSLAGKEGVLTAKWKELPNCPTSDDLLELTRMQGHKRLTDFDYGMAVSVGWSRKRDSPLVRYNRLRQHASKGYQDQLPTPSASEGSDRHGPQHFVKYTFQAFEERYHIVQGLSCPICSAIRTTPEYPSFARLQLHLLTWHDHFRPEVVEEEKSDDSTDFHHTVHLWPAERPTDVAHELSEGEENVWVAPREAFDQAAYLNDQDKWTGHKQPKAIKKPATKRSRGPDPDAAKAQETAFRDPAVRPKKRTSKEMHRSIGTDCLNPQRQKYRVPTVPGVRFYRTVSKRPFEPDEEVEESDDELDESWLTQRLHDDLGSLKLPLGQQEFLEDFNKFVSTGAFAADVLAPAGIIRFTKQHRHKGGNEDWRAAYKWRVQRLLQHRIISRDDAKVCMHLIKERDGGLSAEKTGGGSVEEAGRRAVPGGDTPRDTCVCGKRAGSAHGTIMCDGDDCVRLRFHLHCVKLEQRVDGWLCPDCAPQS